MTNMTSIAIRDVLQQMHEVGFEMMIFSFGSGFNMESTDKKYLDEIKNNVAFAKSLGIEIGGGGPDI